jgi:PAS domain S-box-containing protein
MSQNEILKEEGIETGIIFFKSIRDADHRIVDFEWEFINSNHSYENEYLLGKRLLEERKGQTTQELFKHYTLVMDSEEHLELVLKKIYTNEKKWYHVTASKKEDTLIVSCTDISTLKQKEEALEEQEDFYKFLTDNISDWIVRIDPKGNYLYSSPSGKDISGYELDELPEKNFYEIIDSASIVREKFSESLKKPDGNKVDFRIQTKYNMHKWCEAIAKPIYDSEHNLLEIQCCVRDITERKSHEEELIKLNKELENKVEQRTRALAQQQKQMQLITDALPVMISYIDSDLNFKFVNKTFYKWLGAEEVHRIIEQPFNKVIQEASFENSDAVVNEVLSGTKKHFDHVLKDKDGNIRHLKSSVIPDYDQNNKLLGYVCINIDITEEKLAQKEAKIANELLLTVVNNIPVVFWALDKEGVLTISEGKALESLGLKPGEQVGLSAFELYKDFPDIIYNINRALNGHEVNVAMKVQDVYFQSYYSPIKDSSGKVKGMAGISTDITDRIEMEERLISSEAKYKAMAEGIPQMVWTAFPNGNIDFYNQNWINYTGFTDKDDLENGLKNIVHPADLASALKAWKHSLNTGEELKIEARLQRKKDEVYRWHLIKAWSIKNNQNNILKWLGTCTDIHDQKKQNEELQIKNIELLKTNNDLDNFVYTASHDLKAPISNMEGLIKAIESEISSQCENDDIQQMIMMTGESIQRLKRTISELTEISQIQKNIEEDITNIDIAAIVEEFKLAHKEEVKQNNVKIDLQLGLEYIRFSKKNFRSIVYNLLNNAIKYKHQDRDPEITLKTETFRSHCIVMSVSDNGIGFDVRHKDKMFGMFKRLHSHVDGTGIGLYIVKRIMENTGGQIRVESKEGQGSTFHLYFFS